MCVIVQSNVCDSTKQKQALVQEVPGAHAVVTETCQSVTAKGKVMDGSA